MTHAERIAWERKLFARFVDRERARIRSWKHARNEVGMLLEACWERGKLSCQACDVEVFQMLGMLSAGHAPATRRLRLYFWRSWFRFLYDEGTLLSLRLEDLRSKVPVRSVPTKVLNVDEVERWLGSCRLSTPEGTLDHALLEVTYGCGLRRGELLALELEDLDLGAGLVRVRTSKNGEGRTLPLPCKAVESLSRYLETRRPQPGHENWLWLTPVGRKVPGFYLEHRIANVYKPELDFADKLTLRSLRHSCATHLLQSGADIRYSATGASGARRFTRGFDLRM